MHTEQKTALQKKTDACNSQSVKVLQSTRQMQETMKLLVTSAAVCAANTQVAANAIVKLAGDLGSIAGIVMAADFNTEISNQVITAMESIKKTAYAAELTSQLGMETSMLVSEFGFVSVTDYAETINGQLTKLAPTDTSSFLLPTNKVKRELLTTLKIVLAGTLKQNSTTHAKLNITGKKKSVLDKKAIEISANQVLIDELQVTVDLLTREYNEHQQNVVLAENNRTRAKANKELVNSLALTSKNFVNNTSTLANRMLSASEKIAQLSANLKKVSDLLVKAADLLTICSNKIVKMKALNPLISDDLVSMVSLAGADANSAIALTNVALQSVKQLKNDSLQSKATTVIVKKQALQLLLLIGGKTKPTLQTLYAEAYKKAEIDYRSANKLTLQCSRQLHKANIRLTNTKTRLLALQSALAAGVASTVATPELVNEQTK